MKKVIIITLLLIIPLVFGILNFSEKLSFKKDNEYISALLNSNIREGMPIDELNVFFAKRGVELKPYRESEKDENGKLVFEEFERVITNLPLPSENIWLGEGSAQIYMIIGKDKRLESFFYEIYYPRNH